MLTKTFTYVDFDGNEQTENFYFNLTKTELTELQVSVEGGFAKMLEDVVKAESPAELVALLKKIILISVGVKSADGKRFVKSEQIAEDFAASPAYDQLFMSLADDANVAAEFVNGIMPPDLAAASQEAMAKSDAPTLAPVPEAQG